MEKLVKYETKSEFEENKSLLQTYEDYAALTENDQKVYLKEEDPYFIVNVSGGTAEIKLFDETGNLNENNTTLTLNEGSNKVIAPYGFYYENASDYVVSYDFKKYKTSNVTNMYQMFYGNTNIIELDLSNFDTSNVTNMYKTFQSCRNLVSLDLSNFNTSNVTNMYIMFSNCSKLETLNISNFDTSNISNMENMFYGCRNLTTLDLSSFNTSNVTNMENMFGSCYDLHTLDLSNFDTSNVINMNDMFFDCNRLNYIRCKQAFKDWCITNQDTIELPTKMREGGSGTWDIVG